MKNTKFLSVVLSSIILLLLGCGKELNVGHIETNVVDHPIVGTWYTSSEGMYDEIVFSSDGRISGKYFPFDKTNSMFCLDDSMIVINLIEGTDTTIYASRKFWIVDSVDYKNDSVQILFINNYNSFYTDNAIHTTPLIKKK